MKKHILLADDNPHVRASLAAALIRDGFQVLPAKNGSEALALAATTRIDLVMLDLNLPRQSGWDTFEQLTTRNPRLPIVIRTARPNQLFITLAAGAGALVEKSPDIPALLRIVNTLMCDSTDNRSTRRAEPLGTRVGSANSHSSCRV